MLNKCIARGTGTLSVLKWRKLSRKIFPDPPTRIWIVHNCISAVCNSQICTNTSLVQCTFRFSSALDTNTVPQFYKVQVKQTSSDQGSVRPSDKFFGMGVLVPFIPEKSLSFCRSGSAGIHSHYKYCIVRHTRSTVREK